MVSIKIYGGKDEIGGNKILVEHKGTKIMLDFGMSFKQDGLYFSEFLKPRECAGLNDYFELGLLPDIKGIYREDYLNKMGIQPEKKDLDGVFLSHAHMDHSQYICYLREDIPIFCTEETKIILQAMDNTANEKNDFVQICPSFKYVPCKTKSKNPMKRVKRTDEEYLSTRTYNLLNEEEIVTIGNLKIQMIRVDHSLPGASAFIIYTDEGSIVYSADIRFHGINQKLSRNFIQKAAEAKPKWFLCEGTRVKRKEEMKDEFESFNSEEEVRKQISKLIANTKGLVLAEYPIRDIDRLYSFYLASKENGRKFVVGMKQAYLIEKLNGFTPLNLDDLAIFIPRKSWGLITSPEHEQYQKEQDYEKWEKEFLSRDNSITYLDVIKEPNNYVLSMNLWDINQLSDLKPENATWIISRCEPFNDEMLLDEERKERWLDHFKIKKEKCHASGHASEAEIKNMIAEINPEILIPIHTEGADIMEEFFKSLKKTILVKAAQVQEGKNENTAI